MNYLTVISPIALVEIQPLSCEYGINGLLRAILNGIQDLNVPLMNNGRQHRHIVRSALQNLTTTSWTFSQEMAMGAGRLISTCRVQRCLQQRELSERQPLLLLPLTVHNIATRRV